MAPKKMKQVALEPNMEKNMKVRFQGTRKKAEMGKIIDDQKRIREKQRKIRGRFKKIERQCDQLKEETEMIMKQTARTQIKVVVMFKTPKALKGGDFIEAATLTHFLHEFVANERANATLAEVKTEHP